MAFSAGNTYGKGRPKGSSRVEICKQWAEKKGFQRLINTAEGLDAKGKDAGWSPMPDPNSKKDAQGRPTKFIPGRFVWRGPTAELQFEALKLVLAYGAGKPTESVDITSGGETLADWAFAHFARKRDEQQDRPHIGHGQ